MWEKCHLYTCEKISDFSAHLLKNKDVAHVTLFFNHNRYVKDICLS